MRSTLLAVAALCVFSLAAHADTVFDLNATLQYGSISGTLTLNDSSTAFSGVDLTFVDARDEVLDLHHPQCAADSIYHRRADAFRFHIRDLKPQWKTRR